MQKQTELEKCIELLERNGYKKNDIGKNEFQRMEKENLAFIDLSKKEIAFFYEGGSNILHLPCKYFILIGALVRLKQISVDDLKIF